MGIVRLKCREKKNIPSSGIECKNQTQKTKTKINILFITKTAENLTIGGRTYLYSPFKREPRTPWAARAITVDETQYMKHK